MLFRSLSTVFNHWRGWSPLTFLTVLLFASSKAFLAGASSGSLIKWPSHFSLFDCMVIDHGSVLVVLYKCVLCILFVLTICLRNALWNVSILMISVLFSVQSSALYRKIDDTSASKILILISRAILLLHSDFLFLLKAALASCFLLLMSSLFPKRLPRYLQFFQLLFEFLFIVYSSVLSLLMIKFLSVSTAGMVCFMLSVNFWLVVIQDMSSAYC